MSFSILAGKLGSPKLYQFSFKMGMSGYGGEIYQVSHIPRQYEVL